MKGNRIGLRGALPLPWERAMTATDAEIETLKRDVSCATLLERLPPPWTLDKRESTRQAERGAWIRDAGALIPIPFGLRLCHKITALTFY